MSIAFTSTKSCHFPLIINWRVVMQASLCKRILERLWRLCPTSHLSFLFLEEGGGTMMWTQIAELGGSPYDMRTYNVRHTLRTYDNYAHVRHDVRNTYAHCTFIVRIFVVRRAEHARVRQKHPIVVRRNNCVRNAVRWLYDCCTLLYVSCAHSNAEASRASHAPAD